MTEPVGQSDISPPAKAVIEPASYARAPEAKKLSLRVNFSWTFVGNLLYTAAQFAMVLILGKFGSPSDLGMFAVGQAVCMPIKWLTSLNLRAAMVTDARNQFIYGQYIGLRLLTATALVVVATGAALLGGYSGRSQVVIVLMALGFAILEVREILLGVVFKNERMDLSARSQIILSVAAPVVFTATFLQTQSLILTLIGVMAVRMCLVLFHDFPAARYVARSFAHEVPSASLRPVLHFGALKGLIWGALPLGIAMTLSSLNNSIPVYFLEHHHGEDACGFYAPLAMAMTFSMTMMNTLGTAASPRLANYFVENRRAFGRLLAKMLGIAVVGALAAVAAALLLGKPALRILFTSEYAAYSAELAWMMTSAGLMFIASFLIYAIVAARAFGYLLAGFALVVLTCAGVGSLLIGPHAVAGAAWTRVISGAAAVVALGALLVVKLKRSPLVAAPSPVESGGTQSEEEDRP